MESGPAPLRVRSLAWHPLVWLFAGVTACGGVYAFSVARQAAAVESISDEISAYGGDAWTEAGGPEWLTDVVSEETRMNWYPVLVDVSVQGSERRSPDDEWIRRLAEFTTIRDLSFDECRITGEGLAPLVALPELKKIRLWGSPTGDAGWEHLPRMTSLQSIAAGYTGTTDAGLRKAAAMTQLEYLGVRGCPVTDEGLRSIAGLTRLTGLYLGETRITDAGLIHLRGMTRLRDLWLHNTEVTDAGMEHLRSIPSLRKLSLGGTFVTPDGVSRLEEALPDLKIDFGINGPALPRPWDRESGN